METTEFKPNTQVVLWYIGARGLPTTGPRWYKKNILTPLRDKVSFQLYSLAAWLSVCDEKVKPTRVDKLEEYLP